MATQTNNYSGLVQKFHKSINYVHIITHIINQMKKACNIGKHPGMGMGTFGHTINGEKWHPHLISQVKPDAENRGRVKSS